jgi:hypothetical protein
VGKKALASPRSGVAASRLMLEQREQSGGRAGRGEDGMWAVIATIDRVVRIADIHGSQARARADQMWREQQVMAYLGFLLRSEQPVPRYTVRRMSRSQLPRGWRPLPALGFLYGKMV